MSIQFTLRLQMTREPAECTPGREPGWYVKSDERIIAYCDHEEEAALVVQEVKALISRVEQYKGRK